MSEWIAALHERVTRDGRAVLVTVAHTMGSAPREAGTAMVVSAHDAAGTIGGGHLEFEAQRIARDALDNSGSLGAWIVRFPLAARLGQCCGGVATLAFCVVHRGEHGWLDAATRCLRTHTGFALVSRIGRQAAPMLISADNVTGSLGAADEDSAAIALARARVADGGAHAMLVPPVDAAGSMLLLHVIKPREFSVLLFGNGHVGRALVRVLGALPAAVRWIDGREHDFPTDAPDNVEIVVTDDPANELSTAPRGSCIIIMTHSHTLDFELIETALHRDDWQYLGLIGSRAKRNQFAKRLAVRGTPPEAMQRIVCPIGTHAGIAIRSKEPGSIAVAVAAELLAMREALATADAGGAPARLLPPGAIGNRRNFGALRSATPGTRRT